MLQFLFEQLIVFFTITDKHIAQILFKEFLTFGVCFISYVPLSAIVNKGKLQAIKATNIARKLVCLYYIIYICRYHKSPEE